MCNRRYALILEITLNCQPSSLIRYAADFSTLKMGFGMMLLRLYLQSYLNNPQDKLSTNYLRVLLQQTGLSDVIAKEIEPIAQN